MRIHPAISGAMKVITTQPPWFVRLLGAALMVFAVWWWREEHSPATMLEFAKHGGIFLAGLRLFYPEGFRDVTNFARKVVPAFNRRSANRPAEKPK